jgi:transposase
MLTCGFVIRSEIYPGNISESVTLENILNKFQATDAGCVVMDKLIATAANIQRLNENKYTYLVVNRKQKRIFNFDKSITIQKKGKGEVIGYKELTEDGKEARLYCYSEDISLKESPICKNKSENLNKN